MDKKEEVYTIFKEFFGEDRVDMQGRDILVHFPHVTVTNEGGESTGINHLFAKVKICDNGTLEGTFNLIRTEYTERSFRAGYAHSHIPRIVYDNHTLAEFKTPCLGRGPIKGTCINLNGDFDEDIWRLFCCELSQYVTVESLVGGPYIKIREIGTIDNFSNNSGQPWIEEQYSFAIPVFEDAPMETIAKMFIPYVIKSKKIPFVYKNGLYTIALSPYELVITLSNLFIAWYNTLPDSGKPELNALNREDIWGEYKCVQGKILRRNVRFETRGRKIEEFIGIKLFRFKETTYTLTIPDYKKSATEQEQEGKISILITPRLTVWVAYLLIKKVNYGITRNKENKARKGTFASEIGQDVKVL